MRSNIPNLFVVGLPKCGTTAIYQYLKQHPDIFLSEGKELPYFANDHLEEERAFHGRFYNLFNPSINSDREYLKYYAKRTSEKAIGDITPWHLLSTCAAQEIHRFNPRAKIIIMLREPVDFLYSLHSQLVYDRSEDEPDFEAALNLEYTRRNRRNIPRFITRPSIVYYSEYIKYTEHIKRYVELFDDNNVKIILFDDFERDPFVVYKDILNFIDVDTGFVPLMEKINTNKTARIKLIQIPFIKKALIKITPDIIKYRLSRLLRTINVKAVKRAPLDPELKRRLSKKYRPEVETLSAFLKKDLVALWNYDELSQEK